MFVFGYKKLITSQKTENRDHPLSHASAIAFPSPAGDIKVLKRDSLITLKLLILLKNLIHNIVCAILKPFNQQPITSVLRLMFKIQ